MTRIALQRTTSAVGSILATVINIAAAFLICGILIACIGENPLAVLKVMVSGAFGTLDGIGFTLYYATNLIFTGLAVALAAHANQFNIGGEGQAYVGGLGVGLSCFAMPGLPWYLVLPIAIAAGMFFGAAWAFVPAFMVVKRGSHLVITTIMFNFLASLLMIHVIMNHLRDPDSMNPSSGPIAEGLELPRLDQFLHVFGVNIGESPLNICFIVALLACVAVTYLVWHTRWGYELRATGAHAPAAACAGVAVKPVIVVAICLSGGLAGLVGLNEVMGVQHRVVLDFAQGYGYTGIAVALIGANRPSGIIPAAILFGALYQGGVTLGFLFPAVSRELVTALQGLVILFAGGLVHTLRPITTRAVETMTLRLVAAWEPKR